MRRRKVILISVLLAIILAGAGGGLWWYRHRAPGMLATAELAIEAAKFRDALDMADRFIAKHPDDWQGHYVRAKALVHLKRYADARASLERAAKLNSNQVSVHLVMAETYAIPARQKIASKKLEERREAVAQFVQAGEVLSKIDPRDDDKGALDVLERSGTHQITVASAQRALADRLSEEALLAEAKNDTAERDVLRQEAAAAMAQANLAEKLATGALLDLVKRDASRGKAARALIRLCVDREDHVSLASVRSAILATDDPPPMAVVMLVIHDVRSSGEEGGPGRPDSERAASACQRLDELLKKHPDEAQVKVARAELAAMLSDNDTAKRLCEEVLKAAPRNLQARLLQGKLLLAEGDVAAAEEKLYKLKTDFPQWPAAYHAYARAALAVGKREEARDALLIMQKLDPGLLHVKLMRAELALMVSEPLTAKQLSGEVLRVNPWQSKARLIHANAVAMLGESVVAEKEALALKTDYPKWADAQFAHGRVALTVGKATEAAASLQAALELDPEHVPARKLLAEVRLRSGDRDEAFAEAKACHQARPDDPEALSLFVRAARQTKQTELAKTALVKAAAGAEGNPVMLMAVVAGYRILGEGAEAIKVARRAAESKAPSAEAALAVARALAMTGRTPEAERMLTHQLTVRSDQPALRFELGRIYAATGRVLPAIEQYRVALRLDGRSNTYRLSLARALLNIGDVEQSRKVLERAGSRSPAANALRMRIHTILGEPIDVEQMFPQPGSGERSPLSLAMAHLAAGKPQRAVEICSAELQERPDAVDIRWVLGRAYLSLGQSGKCIQQWEAVLKASPSRLAGYLQLASVLSRDAEPGEVASRLSKITGAQQDIVDLTEGWLHERAGNHAKAAEAFRRPAGRAGAPEHIRGRAKMLRSEALARSGQLDQALAVLDSLAESKSWRKEAILRKAKLMAVTAPPERSQAALDELRKLADAEKDAFLLRQVAELYLRTRQTDKALAVCDRLAELLPNDSRTYLLRASVLRAADKRAETVELYRKAIELQPGNLGIYLALAEVLDAEQRPVAAMEVLRKLDSLGEAGSSLSLFRQGALLASWGLRAQAADRFHKVAGLGVAANPQIRLALGRAFARLGLTDVAARHLKDIPSYAAQYIPARLLLAGLAETDQARLAILRELQKTKPGREGVLVQEMRALLRADKPAEAAAAFQTFVEIHARDKPLPPRAAYLAVQATLEKNDRKAAADLAIRLAEQTKTQQWRRLAALLTLEDRPQLAAKALPPVAEADPLSAALGLCLAVRTKDAAARGQWLGRIAQVKKQSADLKLPARVPDSYELLIALSAGQAKQAKQALARLVSTGGLASGAAVELASSPADRAEEAARLLEASIALELGFPSLARLQAIAVLESRPRCQWAAVLAYRSGADSRTGRKILQLLEPKDCATARVIAAEMARRDKKHSRAAELFDLAAGTDSGNSELALRRATATEAAGRLEEALKLYREILRKQPHAIAANNAASVISQLYPRDAARLAEARKLAETAVKLNPKIPEFRDTLGWVAYLQGRYEQATPELRRAIKGLPRRPDVHYHLGLAEAAIGRNDLARWHLAAAADLGKEFEPAATAEVAAGASGLAAEALARMGPPK